MTKYYITGIKRKKHKIELVSAGRVNKDELPELKSNLRKQGYRNLKVRVVRL